MHEIITGPFLFPCKINSLAFWMYVNFFGKFLHLYFIF